MTRMRWILAPIVTMLMAFPAQADKVKIIEIGTGQRPSIAGDGKGVLHLACESGTNAAGDSTILYSESADGGKSWLPLVEVSRKGATTDGAKEVSSTSSGPSSCYSPRLAVEPDGAIDIVWSEKEPSGSHIFFSRSTDSGKTWPVKMQIAASLKGASTFPSVAARGNGKLDLVWRQVTGGDSDIFHATSENGGKDWQQIENVTQTGSASGEPAVCATSDGAVHLVWPDTHKLRQQDIFYMENEKGWWNKMVNLSNTTAASSHPRISVGHADKLYVTWTDGSKKPLAPDIWCVHSHRRKGFSRPVNISDSPGLSGNPAIASDDRGRVALVWCDTSHNDSYWDAVARLSNDELDDYTNLVFLTAGLPPGDARYPDVAIIKDDAIFVWEEWQQNHSKLMSAAMNLREIATGPAERVYDDIHGIESNSR